MDKTTNQIKHKKVIITQEDDMKKTLIYFPTILLVIFSIILINVASVEAINVFPKGPHFKLMEKLSIRSYPNPFNPETNIEYHLKSDAQVTIYIYDIQGKQVRSLGDNYQQAGTYTIRWDGLNESGTLVPSGVYFIRVSAGNETLNHRIVMMK
jgi:hypothetical protein